ncbi:MAG: winged helix-turn-helix domain-containing protein [Gammaproteobacteria bacterium]
MAQPTSTDFQIAGWQVSADEGLLVRGDEVIHLEPKVMEVLCYFAARPGEVVTREELERDIWHGAIVGYDAVTKTVIKLRKALGDDARRPRCIATIPKKGYQLVASVIFSDATEHTVPAPMAGRTDVAHKLLWVWIGRVAVFMCLVGVAAFMLWPTHNNSTAEVPSLLVLPLVNLDQDKTHNVFADGMTEDIIIDLSSFAGLFVFASHTSFQYQGKEVAYTDLSKELGVDFILEGNIRRLAESFRINVSLIDAKTGRNVWARRYDKNSHNVFGVTSELAREISQALAIKLSSREQQQLGEISTANLKAYDHFLAGQRVASQRTRDSIQQASLEYRRAIELDASYGRAYGALAFNMAVAYRRGWTDTPMETLDRALALAEQATLLDRRTPQTYWVLGYVHMMRKELDAAERAVEKAIAISPNYADGYGLLALLSNHRGNAIQAIKYIKKGMALNPYYTFDYPYNLGRAYYTLGRYKEAIVSLEEAQERNENVMPPKIFLAASYMAEGRVDDAQWTVEQMRVLSPDISLSHIEKTIPISNRQLKQKLLHDLSNAGLS